MNQCPGVGLSIEPQQSFNVPIVLHEGVTEELIVKLADQDNDNDEYHAKVPLVDVWLSYKALADAGWTQQRIAEAKGVSQAHVASRLNYSRLPVSLHDVFISKDMLNERHASEITKLSIADNLAVWLTRETAMLEVIDKVLSKCTKAAPPTAKQFEAVVKELSIEPQQSFNIPLP